MNQYPPGQLPPQPGMNPGQMGPGGNFPNQMGGPPRQQNKGLDPDKIPHPIDVIMKDMDIHAGKSYQTGDHINLGSHPPPLCTTLLNGSYVPSDQGVCTPDYLRAATYSIGLGFGVIVFTEP